MRQERAHLRPSASLGSTETLATLRESLERQLAELDGADEQLHGLEQAAQSAEQSMRESADKLSKKRREAASIP